MTEANDNGPALRACPFCGYEGITIVRRTGDLTMVNCEADDGDGCGAAVIRTTERAAVAAWNRRAVTVEEKSLPGRLAKCLGDAIDSPLLSLPEPASGGKFNIELRLYSFLPEVANEAAELLEEIGL